MRCCPHQDLFETADICPHSHACAGQIDHGVTDELARAVVRETTSTVDLEIASSPTRQRRLVDKEVRPLSAPSIGVDMRVLEQQEEVVDLISLTSGREPLLPFPHRKVRSQARQANNIQVPPA